MKEKRIADKIDRIIQERKKRRIWIKAVSVMAAVVVFISTYLMILPAITLSNDSDSSQTEQTEKFPVEVLGADTAERNETVKTVDSASVPEDDPAQAAAGSLPDNSAADVSLLSVPEDAVPLSEAECCIYSVSVESGDGSFAGGDEGIVSTRTFSIILTIYFEFGWQDANRWQRVYYYELPDGVSFIPMSGNLTDSSGYLLGGYECTEDGYLLITLNDRAMNGYYLNLSLRRTVSVNDGNEGEFVFDNGPTITVPNDADTGINAPRNKDVEVQENADGSIDYKYTLTVTAEDETLPNLHISDEIAGIDLSTEDMILCKDYSVGLFYTNVSIGDGTGEFSYDGIEGAVPIQIQTILGDEVSISAAAENPMSTENGCSQSLEFHLDQLPVGCTLTVQYTVTVAADARVQIDAVGETYALNNTAQFYYMYYSPENNTLLGSNSTYSPYEGDVRWLQKERGEMTQDSVLWNLTAGTDKYTMNGMYVMDEIERYTYGRGVYYLMDEDHPAAINIYNTVTGESVKQKLEWEYVESLENLTDQQKADNTKLYWHENSFVWYSGTDDSNQTPYIYNLTYYTSYVEEVFGVTDQINGAHVFYKDTSSGVEPDAPGVTEITLTKGMEELSGDGKVRYTSEIHSNGQYVADHFALYDYMPMTTVQDGDQLTSHSRLVEYVQGQNPLELSGTNLEEIQTAVKEGRNAFYYAGQYILLFDSVAEMERITGIHFEVEGEDGTILEKEELLAQGDKKVVFLFNAEPFPAETGSRYAYLFGIQFNADIAGSTELVDGLPGSAGVPTYDQGYTIRMSYETDAHRWGDSAYAGDAFVNRQEMHFRVPDISSVENVQHAEAYYYFSALSDTSILNKYISAAAEDPDGTVTLTYTVYIDFSGIDMGNKSGVWLYDAARETEELRYADFSSVENYENFLSNASISIDTLPTMTLESLMDDNLLQYADAESIEDSIAASMSEYSPVFALRFNGNLVNLVKRTNGKVRLSYPVTIDPDEISFGQGDYDLRNFVRLYTENDSGEQSPVSESWADYGITENVLGKFQIQRPTEDNSYIADWRIVVNPDKLEPEDSNSFTVRDSFGESQTIIPSSIKIYGVRDGIQTEVSAECIIDAVEGRDTMLITVNAGEDGKWQYSQYIIEYQTQITGNPGETVKYDNTAEIVGMETSRDEVSDTIYISEGGASIEGGLARISVNKYDTNNVTEILSGVKFSLCRMNPETAEYVPGMTMEEFLEKNKDCWECIAKGCTDENGNITWEYQSVDEGLQYIVPGVLFSIEETEAPEGYIKAEPVYGYISGDGGAEPPDYLELFTPFRITQDGTAYTIAHVYIANIKTTALEIRKVADDEAETPLEGAVFGLYSDAECTTLIRQGLEINGGIHKFGNLEPGTYYIKEITAPEGYRPLESVLQIVVGDDGTITSSGGSDAWVGPQNDGEGYYIKVLNQSGYALPETGGTGTVPYMAGGTLLILSAGVAYVIMRRKEGRKT